MTFPKDAVIFDPMSMKFASNIGCMGFAESATELGMMLAEFAATKKTAYFAYRRLNRFALQHSS